MPKLRVLCVLCAILPAAAHAGTISYYSRDAWELAGPPQIDVEDFSTANGNGPLMNFAMAAITSVGTTVSSSTADPRVSRVDTSFLDLSPAADGGNYLGSVGRTTDFAQTNTYTNTEWCKNGVCTAGTLREQTDSYDYSDVRSLEIAFAMPVWSFGFDYVAFLSGTSPNRMTHPFRMALSYIDGTTSRLWVGGGQVFADYNEGFMGVRADKPVRAVTLRAANRSLGAAYSSTGGDWTYEFSRPRKGDFYTYSLTETFSVDQSSALWIHNLSIATPEPGTIGLTAGGLLVALALRARSRKPRG